MTRIKHGILGESVRSALRVAFLTAFAAASANSVSAQDVTVTASVSETTVGAEESVTYTIEIAGRSLPQISAPEAPQTRGFVLANRFPFTSQNMSIVNGRVQQSVGYSWTFRPVEEGEGVFFPVELEIEGKTYRTREITVKVVPQAQRPPQAPRRNPFLMDPFDRQPPAQEREITERDMFIRATPSKRKAYQNEQVVIEYSLYFRSGIQLRQSRLADSWDAEGFWREELEIDSRPVPENVVVNGLRYKTVVLKRVAVFPTRAGTLTIDPLRIESEASMPFGSGDPFFSLRNRYQPVRLSSPAVTVEVLPWPASPPTSFTGAVGEYRLTAKADREALEVGESVQITVNVTGSGNIATLDNPAFRPPGVFEAYDPEVNTRVDRSSNRVRGSKTFQYVLVPRSNGFFEIPPIEFSFFNPLRARYVTLRSDAISISVSGTSGPVTEVATTAAGLPVDDIGPLKNTIVRWRSTDSVPIHQHPALFVVAILPLLAIGGLKLWTNHADRLATDVAYARKRRAHPLAKRHLKAADKLLESNSGSEFYEELERAVLGFVGNRLNISEHGMTRSRLIDKLRVEGIADASLERLSVLLERCDHARFAPTRPVRAEMEASREDALRLIIDLDKAFSESKAV